jgi:hypothetical protein
MAAARFLMVSTARGAYVPFDRGRPGGRRAGVSTRRVVGSLLAMMLAAAVGGGVISSAAADPASSDSAVMKSGTGEFANLKVTVGQTKNLVDQTVTVSWTGGKPTVPADGEFGADYLQIMQCWGDDPAGPDRTQCQYGGSDTQSSPTAGPFVRSRQVTYTPHVDPKETLKQPAGSGANLFVPFWAVGQAQQTVPAASDHNDFFDSQVTNEDPLARTNGDGTGQEFFEVETVVQAAGLGCGAPVTAGGTAVGRPCWLVIVPRGNAEVDGSTHVGEATSDYLYSSPLSQSNWDNRIVFPLGFRLVSKACPIGAPERRVIGHELVTDAVTSWQPVLCANGGALYSYTQLTDDVARGQVLDGSSPGLAVVNNLIPSDQVPPDHPLVYAPVGLSGLAIAFNIEHQPAPTASPADLLLAGQRFTSMKLTPRLMAKLLTQSYRSAVYDLPDAMKNNPIGLTVDPEFLALNPEYQGFAFFNTPPDALVQLNGADVTSLLWSWITADPDARAFLTGTPDQFKMVINPQEKGLTLPTSVFPRNDQSCVVAVIGEGNTTGKLCTSDAHSFASDMHDAGRSASRGDSKALTTVLSPEDTPISKKVDRQSSGQYALLAVVDVATAIRYGLPTAALLNTAGQYVTPTTASLLAGEAVMKPGAVTGVLASDPIATNPAAYPLTTLSYAVTAPSALDTAAGKDYATFLRYAAGPGQQPGIEPGQLPVGMVPLPDDLKAQTAAAAATIEAQAGKAVGALPRQPFGAGTTSGDLDSSTGGASVTGDSGVSSSRTGSGATAAGSPAKQPISVAPGGSTSTAPSLPQEPVARVRRTPALSAPAVGALLLVILICGALAATSSPVVRFLGVAVRRRTGKGVMPTER